MAAAGDRIGAGLCLAWESPSSARRARSSWLLLACVAVTVLLATGLAAAAWTFAAAAIPPGAQSILAAPQGRVIGLSGVRRCRAGGRRLAADPGHAAARPGRGSVTRWKARCGRTRSRSRRPGPSALRRARFRDFRTPVAWQLQVAALAGIRAQAVLTAGTWPGPPHPGGPAPGRAAGGRGQPAARGARLGPERRHRVGPHLGRAARHRPVPAQEPGVALLGAGPGARLRLRGQPPGGQGPPGSLVVYGPAVVNPAAFRGGLAASQASWFALPQAPAIAHQNVGALAGSTSRAVTKLATLILP